MRIEFHEGQVVAVDECQEITLDECQAIELAEFDGGKILFIHD